MLSLEYGVALTQLFDLVEIEIAGNKGRNLRVRLVQIQQPECFFVTTAGVVLSAPARLGRPAKAVSFAATKAVLAGARRFLVWH